MSEPASCSCRNTPPDLNPIEQVFAKFKTLLRKAEARSYEAISDASGKILAQYPPQMRRIHRTQDIGKAKCRRLYMFRPRFCWGILIERFEGCAMGQVLHGSATTTEAVRRAIQHSQESLRALAKRHGVNPKTIAKWKARKSVSDLRTGPKEPRSTVLSAEEEAVVVAFRRHALLPLDDCLYALQPTIPHLTRSSLHRCLQRHGISRLPQVEGEASAKRKFKAYPIGYFHIDIAEVRTPQGKLSLIVAIDRTSKFAFVEMHEKVARRTAGDFLRRLTAAVPYKVHTVLTDNGTHFTTPGHTSSAAPDIKGALEAGELVWAHAFEYACAQNDIDHRLTKPKPPWTNGQVERMNRTIKDATVKRDFYETHDQLRAHLQNFVDAYNFARRLKPSKASLRTSSSAKPGPQSRKDSNSIRSSKCRD